MRYGFFIGCNIPARLPQYETSARAVLEALKVELVDIPQYNCCGYPMRNQDRTSYLLSAAKNLALSEAEGLDTLVLCKCCFGTLKHAEMELLSDSALLKKVNDQLADLGLGYTGKFHVRHMLTVLDEWVGRQNVENLVKRRFTDLTVAAHTGCHALRPSRITEFDDPLNPGLLERVLGRTGAKAADWKNKLECCGAPLMGSKDDTAVALMKNKIQGAREAGAEVIVTGCPWCQLQFDVVQDRVASENGSGPGVPAVLFTQLLGLAMDLDPETLGLDKNLIDIAGLADRL